MNRCFFTGHLHLVTLFLTLSPCLLGDSGSDIAIGGTAYYGGKHTDMVHTAAADWTTMQRFPVVDDFESYDDADNRIFDTWLDGWVNNNGSTVGYFNAPFAERDIVHGGSQSMPLFYDNTSSPFYSEAEREFETAQDWSGNGVQYLWLYFYGDTGNTVGQLYVKINNTRIDYDGSADNLSKPEWHLLNIDLSTFGDVSRVNSLAIGIEGAEAKGILYIDDIWLRSEVFPTSDSEVAIHGRIHYSGRHTGPIHIAAVDWNDVLVYGEDADAHDLPFVAHTTIYRPGPFSLTIPHARAGHSYSVLAQMDLDASGLLSMESFQQYEPSGHEEGCNWWGDCDAPDAIPVELLGSLDIDIYLSDIEPSCVLVDTFDADYLSPPATSMDYYDGYLWICQASDADICQVDPNTGALVNTYDLGNGGRCTGIEWIGNDMWACFNGPTSWTVRQHTYNGQAFTSGKSYALPMDRDSVHHASVAWDGRFLWIQEWRGCGHIYRLDLSNGELLDTVSECAFTYNKWLGFGDMADICFSDGYLWAMNDSSATFAKIAPDPNQLPPEMHYTFAFDPNAHILDRGHGEDTASYRGIVKHGDLIYFIESVKVRDDNGTEIDRRHRIHTARIEQDAPDGSGDWIQLSSMRIARDQFAGAVIGDEIFVFGGNAIDGTNLYTGEKHNIATDTWSDIADNPRFEHPYDPDWGWGVEEISGVGFNGKFYVFGAQGGYDDLDGDYGAFNFNQRYDPVANTWITLAKKPTTVTGAGIASYGGRIFLFGGSFSSGTDEDEDVYYRTVEAYDPQADEWQSMADMPKPLKSMAIAVHDNSAYLIGGYAFDDGEKRAIGGQEGTA